MELVTYSEHPQRWGALSALVSMSTRDGSAAVAMTGWRNEVVQWEGRWPGEKNMLDLAGLSWTGTGNTGLLASASGSDSVELEMTVGDHPETERQLQDALLPGWIAERISELPEIAPGAVNKNQPVAVPQSWKDRGVTVTDMPINSLPSTRQQSLPLIYATRWVRLVSWDSGILSLWHPPDGFWPDEHVRWPHHGIPSRSPESLRAISSGHISAESRLLSWTEDVLAHELYHLSTWSTEMDLWQGRIYKSLDRDVSGEMISSLRSDLGKLATYRSNVVWTQRALLRRSKEDGLENASPRTMSLIQESAETIQTQNERSRHLLRDSFNVLNSLSQQVQEEAARHSRELSERLSRALTILTAVFFMPSLIAAVFGANLEVFVEGGQGNFGVLLILMVGTALVSLGILSIGLHPNHRHRPSSLLLVAAGSVTITAGLWASLAGLVWILVAVAFVVTALICTAVFTYFRFIRRTHATN